jgi:predicted amidohydrolase YtcJ
VTAGVHGDLLIEGRIATLAGKAGWGWVEALAIADGRVVGAGRAIDVEVFAGPRTRRWTLPSDTLAMPGITDAHMHLVTLALARTQVDLTATPDLGAALDVLAAAHKRRAAAGDTDGWLLGYGWSLHGLGTWPDATMLERACPGRPVALYAHDHHSRWVSHRALQLAGIDETTPDPAGGALRRDPDGRLTGILHESASSLVDVAIPDPADRDLEQAIIDQAADLAALGVTGAHDPGELRADRQIRRGPLLYRRLAEQERLPLRVHSSIRSAELAHAIELGLRSGEGVGNYRMGWLKLFADGSLGSRSAALLEPYTDAATHPPTGGPAGMFIDSPAELAEDLARAAAAGISGQVHAIGDAAVRAVLDVFATTAHGPLAARIEHAQLVDPIDVPRFGQLGVAASVQPVHLRSDAAPARSAWGERSENAFPLAALVASGALIPFGTDAPVEPPDPWPGLAIAVARGDPDQPADVPVGPRHAIDLDRSVRAACLDPAVVAGESDLGWLGVGCRADLLVVPSAGFREPFDAADLARTRPLATLIGGKIVYRDHRFDP